MSTFSTPYGPETETSAGASLYSRVAVCFVFSCVATALGAYAGRDLSSGAYLVAVIAFFASYVVLFLVRKIETINVIALLAFTFIAGLTIGPTIAQYTSVPGGGRVLADAMLLSAMVFSGSAAFGWMTSANLEGLSRYLTAALFVLIGFGLLLMFFITSRTAEIAYDLGIMVVFVGYTAVDFQRIRTRYEPSDYILVTAMIYLDALNLFLALLDLLGGNRRD